MKKQEREKHIHGMQKKRFVVLISFLLGLRFIVIYEFFGNRNGIMLVRFMEQPQEEKEVRVLWDWRNRRVAKDKKRSFLEGSIMIMFLMWIWTILEEKSLRFLCFLCCDCFSNSHEIFSNKKVINFHSILVTIHSQRQESFWKTMTFLLSISMKLHNFW